MDNINIEESANFLIGKVRFTRKRLIAYPSLIILQQIIQKQRELVACESDEDIVSLNFNEFQPSQTSKKCAG